MFLITVVWIACFTRLAFATGNDVAVLSERAADRMIGEENDFRLLAGNDMISDELPSIYPSHAAVAVDDDDDDAITRPHIPTMDGTCRLFQFGVSFVLVGVTCLFGFLGNVLSVLTLRRDTVRSVTTFLLSALAVADIAFLVPAVFVIMMPTYCEFYQHCSNTFQSAIPYLGQYGWAIASTCHTCTVYITVLVAIHRYLCVCRIELAQKYSGFRRVRFQVALVPPLALVYNTPRFFEYKIIYYVWNDTSADQRQIRTETVKILAAVGRNDLFQIGYKNLLFFIVMYLVPLVILVMVSVSLMRKLKRRRHTIQKTSYITLRAIKQRKKDDSITLVLVVIIAAFIVCQTPTMIQRLTLTLSGSSYIGCGHFYFYLEPLADYMALLNSSTNFVIYILFSPHFRHTLLTDVLCQRSELQKHIQLTSATRFRRTEIQESRTNANGVLCPRDDGSRVCQPSGYEVNRTDANPELPEAVAMDYRPLLPQLSDARADIDNG